MKKRKSDILHYLDLLQKKEIDPNFWVSYPYLNLAGVECFTTDNWTWIEENGTVLFPAIELNQSQKSYPFKSGWADFGNLKFPEGELTFLDYEYLYMPSNFLNMKGKRWTTFRKNSRKWPKRIGGKYCYESTSSNNNELESLLISWLENEKTGVIHDDEVLMKFIFESLPGVRRKSLTADGKLFGINIWDENYKYLNYRVCICDPNEPFLNEFCRLLFYTDPIILNSKKVVNDGGVLDRTGLEKFKDKLNPLRKRTVLSWSQE